MKYSFYTLITNICSRLTYILTIALILILLSLFPLDILMTTTFFSQTYFKGQTADEDFVSISQPLPINSYMLNFTLPGQIQLALTAGHESCLVYRYNRQLALTDLPQTFVKTEKQLKIANQIVSCIDSVSFDLLNDQFFYEKFNHILLFCVVVSCIAASFGGVLILLCCSGWCGCSFCKVLTICYDDNKVDQGEYVRIESQ